MIAAHLTLSLHPACTELGRSERTRRARPFTLSFEGAHPISAPSLFSLFAAKRTKLTPLFSYPSALSKKECLPKLFAINLFRTLSQNTRGCALSFPSPFSFKLSIEDADPVGASPSFSSLSFPFDFKLPALSVVEGSTVNLLSVYSASLSFSSLSLPFDFKLSTVNLLSLRWRSGCNLSAVSCQLPFSFSPAADTSACVSAFSSPNVDALDAASSISLLFATLTKTTRGWGVPSFSANSVPSALKSIRALPSTDPFDALHYPLASCRIQLSHPPLHVLCVSAFSFLSFPFDFKLSTVNLLSPNSFTIRTYAKHTRNPFRIRTSKTKDLKPFRMNTYEKRGEGVPHILPM